MELRQLRYFVTLAEELHFGRAAAREYIVQSAISQQLQRLERELGVSLLKRTTHHVKLTPAGSALLVEARQILAHVERATVAAQLAASSAPVLRVGIVDSSYDSMPLILRQVRVAYPNLEIHQVEVGVPEQVRQLVDGRLDIGLGRAFKPPTEVASELVRLDPLGVLVSEGHHLASLSAVPVAALATEELLLTDERRAPEFNQFVMELCRSVGFVPHVYRGTVDSVRAATDLIGQGWCVVCAPASCALALPGVVWRSVVKPATQYPWSVLWRSGDRSEHVRAVLSAARRLANELGWLEPRAVG